MKRQSGILLHISSLPNDFGIGDFGPSAFAFIDFLEASRQSLWQILPLTPTDPFWGNSPYSSHSAFAGNVLFISPQLLLEDQLILADDLLLDPSISQDAVNFQSVITFKKKLLERAFKTFQERTEISEAFEKFLIQHKDWLDDYAMYCVFRQHFKSGCWSNWPDEVKNRHADALKELSEKYEEELLKVKFDQYLFYSQWEKVRDYAKSKNIKIVGDLPIYVNYDSADVWKDPKNFKLDANGKMKVVSGVPPDYFSKKGQRWGNPVFDWDYMTDTDFDWWIRRIEHNLKLYDYVRIDHFRAFVNYWEIPSKHKTALKGHWADVPTKLFFKALKNAFGELPFIAEDLGLIDDKTKMKIDALGFPGMKVLLFAFGGDMEKHMYLPHNYTDNCAVYSGTHDNNTVQGWFADEATKKELLNFEKYYSKYGPKGDAKHDPQAIHWEMIELAFFSEANQAIVPMQDVLGLGAEARINRPGTVEKNWLWRLKNEQLNVCLSQRLAELTIKSKR